jgi:hypothetical protein
MNQLEQRRVVLSLRLKDFSKKAIHYELVAVLQAKAVSYSSMRIFCREVILDLNSEKALSAIIAQR